MSGNSSEKSSRSNSLSSKTSVPHPFIIKATGYSSSSLFTTLSKTRGNVLRRALNTVGIVTKGSICKIDFLFFYIQY